MNWHVREGGKNSENQGRGYKRLGVQVQSLSNRQGSMIHHKRVESPLPASEDEITKEKGFTGIAFWGVTDAYWTNELGQRGTDYPLLFDENYQPKPAYWGVMDALLGR